MRRDPRSREDRTLFSCVATLMLPREATSNTRWKFTVGVSRGVADTLVLLRSISLERMAQ